jgi:hypothetical protein
MLEPLQRTTAGRGAAEGCAATPGPALASGVGGGVSGAGALEGSSHERQRPESMGLIETVRTTTPGRGPKRWPMAWSPGIASALNSARLSLPGHPGGRASAGLTGVPADRCSEPQPRPPNCTMR